MGLADLKNFIGCGQMPLRSFLKDSVVDYTMGAEEDVAKGTRDRPKTLNEKCVRHSSTGFHS
eukprot:5573128-Amphidinium_carterae.1